MASDVALSLAQRTTLIALQEIERDSAVAQRRLSFGRRIVDVTDDPAQFFQARGLSLRIENFLQRRSQIDQGVSNLQAQLNGLTGLRGFLNQAIGIVDQAQSSNTDADQLANLTTLFEETLKQFVQLAEDVSYNGQNLITSTSQSLTVSFSDKTDAKLEVDGVNVLGERDTDNSQGLFTGFTIEGNTATAFSILAGLQGNADTNKAINAVGFSAIHVDFIPTGTPVPVIPPTTPPTTTPNPFAATELDKARTAIAGAVTTLRENLVNAVNRIEQIESYFANNVAILQNRLSFTIAYGNTLTIGRDKIVVADVNEEAANLITLRTRSQIGIGALAANASTEQQLLRLLQQ